MTGGGSLTKRSQRRIKLYPYKSQFEKDFHIAYPQLEYEQGKLKYVVEHTYNPDWKVKENVYIETKGLFKAADRAKHLYLREQHPDVKIYLVFQNPNNKLSRVSKTTYAAWADKHGVEWTTLEMGIPGEWLE